MSVITHLTAFMLGGALGILAMCIVVSGGGDD